MAWRFRSRHKNSNSGSNLRGVLQFLFHGFRDFLRSSVSLLFIAPFPLRKIIVGRGQSLRLRGTIDSFGEAKTQINFDLIEVVPCLDLRRDVLPAKYLKERHAAVLILCRRAGEK